MSTVSDDVGLSLGFNQVTLGSYEGAVDGHNASAARFITWEFPFSIFAVGMDFVFVGVNGLHIEADFDGTGVLQTYEVYSSIGDDREFLGSIGSSAFSQLRFSNPRSIDSFNVDNLAFAAAVAAVPEPASFFLRGMGLIAMSLLRVRQKN